MNYDDLLESISKYNYWGKSRPTTGYTRSLYLKKIAGFIENPLTKALVGQRRTGKSYIMRQIIDSLISQGVKPINTLYLNKEFLELDTIKNYRQLADLVAFYKKKNKITNKLYLFLDEVQEIEGWEKTVNALTQNPSQSYEVFITGSNSKMLSSELSTHLSGRFVDFEIFPFSYEEFLGYNNLPNNKQSFIDYLKIGGLPEVIGLKNSDEELKQRYIASLTDSILLNDILNKFNVDDPALLRSLFNFMAGNIGGINSLNKIVGFLKNEGVSTNVKSVSNYLDYLEQAFLLHSLSRYDIQGKAYLASGKKYYLNDIAFRRNITSGFDPALGKYLENVIYIYLRSKGYKLYSGELRDGEIDLIAEKDGNKAYFQIAYQISHADTYTREFGQLQKINDNYEKTVITADDLPLKGLQGIRHVLAWEFLTSYHS